jgi:four helix bundle protein
MTETRGYRDLEIYQESRSLANKIHQLTLELPKFELYEEGSQVRRSSKAVTAMIVEGYGRRRYKADYIKHLVIAHAECDETMVHLNFLFDNGSLIDALLHKDLISSYETLSRKINKFIEWVEENWEE